MTITLTVPDDTLAALLADAKEQGCDAASLAADRLSAWYEPDPLYAPEGGEAELAAVEESLRAVAEGRTKPFDADAVLRRYGVVPREHDSAPRATDR